MASESTKSKILTAAVDVFAEYGYPAATVAIICKRAEVNIAAISYHFGSKDELFMKAIRHAFELAEEVYPLADPDAITPEDQLRHLMGAIIRRGFDLGPAGRIDQILSQEIVRSSSPHHFIVQEAQRHQGEILRKTLSRLMQTRSTRLINQAHANIAGLCFFPRTAIPLRKLLFPEEPTQSQLEQYIEGQFEFALAGLNALKPSLSSKL